MSEQSTVDFKPGDVVVWVKDLGTKKTVERIETDPDKGSSFIQIHCVWFIHNSVHRGIYSPSELQKFYV